MRDEQQEAGMKVIRSQKEKAPARDTRDSGTVQIGAMTPTFPPVSVAPSQSQDSNKIRMGAMTPTFPQAPQVLRRPQG